MSEIIIVQMLFTPIFSLAGVYIGYRLSLKSQRIQALRQYVTTVVREEYPALSSEINDNMLILDNFLEKPLENFVFRKLDNFYDEGLDVFMKKHHEDLFLSIDYMKKEIVPKLYELNKKVGETIRKIFETWNSELTMTLPSEVKKESRNIVYDLIRSINQHYVFPDLLNNRKDVVKEKIEGCILSKTAHIYQEKAKMPFVIKGQTKYIDYDRVFDSLLKSAKLEIDRVLRVYQELLKQIDKKVKSELLPLLHKFISVRRLKLFIKHR